jgi:hypothetical protein
MYSNRILYALGRVDLEILKRGTGDTSIWLLHAS